VVGLAGYIKGNTTWLCRCDCGQLFLSRTITVANRPTTCGCRGKGVQKHGGSYLPEYVPWMKMLKFHGDQICKRWRDFKAFRADVGRKPKERGYGIVRLDRSKPYGPGNVKWVREPRRRPKLYTLRGESLTLREWSERLGVTYEGLRRRILKCQRDGVDVSQALAAPADTFSPNRRAT
jgi:hypothetical protein